MTQRPATLAIVLAVLSVPPLLALVDGASYRAANRSNGTLISSGIEREYFLHVPPGMDLTRPVPLVLSLHGAGGWPAMQRDVSHWNEVADREGFIVVYPSARAGRGPRVFPGDQTDVRYIADLIDHVAASHDIDRRRIYANGLSNGGGMSFVLSCAMPDRIAAVGMVASAQLVPWSACQDTRPVPMIAFHGTDDTLTPYHGGSTWIAPPGRAFADIPAFVARWSQRNRCAAEYTDTRVATAVTRRAYSGCANRHSVELFTIEGGGHTWPGGAELPRWFAGPTTHAINATQLMWEFFRDHPLQ